MLLVQWGTELTTAWKTSHVDLPDATNTHILPPPKLNLFLYKIQDVLEVKVIVIVSDALLDVGVENCIHLGTEKNKTTADTWKRHWEYIANHEYVFIARAANCYWSKNLICMLAQAISWGKIHHFWALRVSTIISEFSGLAASRSHLSTSCTCKLTHGPLPTPFFLLNWIIKVTSSKTPSSSPIPLTKMILTTSRGVSAALGGTGGGEMGCES